MHALTNLHTGTKNTYALPYANAKLNIHALTHHRSQTTGGVHVRG